MFGRFAAEMLADFIFVLGFFGAASINDAFEVTTPTIEKMRVNRETPKQCRKAYLAVDHSKFKKQAMAKVNCLGDYTGVVTDQKFTEKDRKLLNEMGAVIIEV